MNKTIPVNFHCHSIFSDGDQTPEILASNLAAAGVQFAALTDHDSIEGLHRFETAAKKAGITTITGVELTTQYNGREIHLLGLGFDADDANLAATLISMRQVKDVDVQSIAGSLRKIGTNRIIDKDGGQTHSLAPNGKLQIADAIRLIHQAGGITFLAHPLVYDTDLRLLEELVVELISLGLDGIEAIYSPFSIDQRDVLSQIANKHDLLVSAGTDFHLSNGKIKPDYRVDMPGTDWEKFRSALFSINKSGNLENSSKNGLAGKSVNTQKVSKKERHFRRRSYFLRIFIPTLIAIALFLVVIWGYLLPSYEQSLLDRKRDMIRELTNSAWSILDSYHKDELKGILTTSQAQKQAAGRIENLRYGPEGKDYFWIQDMEPRMIMHPYRKDLNGQDLKTFTDARGVPIFVEFANLVQKQGQGYINYVWQWKDDPQRLEPKESYVRGFEPWGWIIGTGLYTDDVLAEIGRIERNLINTSLAISGMVVLLLIFVLQQSLRIERDRQEILDNLHESTEKYHSLVESTTEGTLLIINNRFKYANPIFLSMIGYQEQQLQFLCLEDILPREPENKILLARFEGQMDDTADGTRGFEGVLKNANGNFLDCILTINPVEFAGQNGFILLARETARNFNENGLDSTSYPSYSIPLGIFRCKTTREADIIEMNSFVKGLFPISETISPNLAGLFPSRQEFDQFMRELRVENEIHDLLLHIPLRDDTIRIFSLSAILVEAAMPATSHIDGILQDVTEFRMNLQEQAETIEKLQTSLLFLHEPVLKLGSEAVICNMDKTIADAARMMSNHQATSVLVSSENSVILGIVTDNDFRKRVIGENISPETPLHKIMSAPLIKINEHALIYEALMLMEEKGIRHLAVENDSGEIINVIDNKALIQFHRYGPVVLTREIARTQSSLEIARLTENIPTLVSTLMDSGAKPGFITNLVTSMCDSATVQLIKLGIKELGQPPADFAFLALGSQGRQEQTLITDQDNGIIYNPDDDSDQEKISQYFLQLGAYVCEGLNQAGYLYCKGKVMANNPRWCRSLKEWIRGVSEWTHELEPQEVINLSIFLDFRCVFGNNDLSNQLRQSVNQIVKAEPPFYHSFAQNTLAFKPPFRLLGNIYLGGAAEQAGEINLKDALMPIVTFARLYAIRHQLTQTHTMQRIETLCDRKIISPSTRDEISTAYNFLMQMRIQNQVKAFQDGKLKSAGNIIHLNKLGYMQQELLKQAFAEISIIQKKVGFDFP